MTTLINFPTPKSAPAISIFKSAADAEASAASLAGATFVLGHLDIKSLGVLSLPQLRAIYAAANPDTPTPTDKKRDLIQRVLPLIPSLATKGEAPTSTSETQTMATKKGSTKKGKKAAAAKKDKKAAAAPKDGAESKAGRPNGFAGKKLYKTEKGSTRMQEKGRRFASFQVITNGMLYETALEKGAHQDDIANMVMNGRLEAK